MAIYVSASSLADFISCSQKVYYRIFEAGEAIPSREMLMGTITHKVLEKAWKDKDVALNLANALCAKEDLDATARQTVEHFIHTYFERFSFLVRPDDGIEKRFKVKLHDDVYLVGVFDRVSSGTIIDWKTNSKPPKNIDGSIQFILYDLAYNLIYGTKTEGLYLAALKDGSLVRYKESKQHTEILVTQVIPDFVDAVKNKKFVRSGLFNGSCYRCQYKQNCLGDKINELDNSIIAEE